MNRRRRSRNRRSSNNNSRGQRGKSKSKGETVRGLLAIYRDGFGFLRTEDNNYASTKRDVFVPGHFIERFDLRPGVEIVGTASDQKTNKRPLTHIETVDGMPPASFQRIPEYRKLMARDPDKRILLEMPDGDLTLRVIDLITPIGFGQRALIVAPPRTGKTVILHKLTQAILHNHKDAEVYVLLVDERPEEVTDFTRSCEGAKIFSSSLDKDTAVHCELSELVFERARRRVEEGKDVVLLMDSLTRMARAFNNERGRSGRTLSGGLDAQAMQKPREFFGAARAVDEGSLTVIATALVDTGSRLDQVIFEEFKGTGNLELCLTRRLADHRIFPAIEIRDSATRKEEKLRTPEEMQRVNALRRFILKGNKAREAMQGLLKRLSETQNNAQFLMGLPV